jgi:probable rRNA maturation factor
MSKQADIQFHYTIDTFDINHRKISLWIEKLILNHQKKAGEINLIFCDDEYLRKLNKKFLKHDYYTDIISFPLGSQSLIEGELYISIDRVKDNARTLKMDFEWELLRVIIHGILHFLGYKDKTEKEILQIRQAEDKALKFYKDEFLKDDHYFDRVYDVVRCIPKGKVCSYGIIADYLSLGSARMVGWALNQLEGHVTDIPAHRVVNVKGELSGRLKFGDGGERMGKLLIKEGVKIKNYKVQNLESYLWHPS